MIKNKQENHNASAVHSHNKGDYGHMQQFEKEEKYTIYDLLNIMEILRSENGCPWDREQNHASIRGNLIEEVYELIDAIDEDDSDSMREELGDVLLQVVFHSQIATEKDRFDFDDVSNDICEKLIIRHPHIFDDIKVDNTDEVLRNWDSIKMQTKNQHSHAATLQDIPRTFTALMRSQKIGSRAGKAGYRYDSIDGAMRDLKSELKELEQAIKTMTAGDTKHCEEELGDLLFSCVNVAREIGIDAELALSKSCDKFVARFCKAEEIANSQGKDLKDLNAVELDKLWKRAKECYKQCGK